MIEWYRIGFTLREIMQDALNLTASLVSNKQLPDADFVSYASAFETTLSIDPLAASPADLADSLAADQTLRNSMADDRDAWLDLAMATRVSEGFASDRLTVVHHYPASQAALSRLCPDDSRFADRFEVFWGKIELANGFVELTDADEQLGRFVADNQKRSSAGQPVLEIDGELIDALHAGLPPCAGVALGLDRVLMINEAQNDIRNVTTFLPGGNNDR
jgi:lysyl-tRNA synthetase class 2